MATARGAICEEREDLVVDLSDSSAWLYRQLQIEANKLQAPLTLLMVPAQITRVTDTDGTRNRRTRSKPGLVLRGDSKISSLNRYVTLIILYTAMIGADIICRGFYI